MRTLSKSALVLTASVLLAPAAVMMAQPPEGAPGGAQAGVGGPGGGRGGFDRMGQAVQGTVIAASSGKLTIKTDAGDTYEISVGDNARIMKDRQAIQLTDIKPGDSVTAMGQVDTAKKTVQAMMIRDIDAATLAKAKENLGKTYITGHITAIDADNLKLTVQRQDNISQVIQVDEGTSFQRGMRGVAADIQAAGGMAGGFGGRGMGGRAGRQGGGGQAGAPPAPESITLADIKVGDIVAATGSLKNGSFTVQKMGVAEPGGGARGQGGQRGAAGPRGPESGADAPPPPPAK